MSDAKLHDQESGCEWKLIAITGGYLSDPHDPFSPDGRYLVIPKLWTHAFAIYDVQRGFCEISRCVGHSAEVTSYRVTSDGTKLVSFSRHIEEGSYPGGSYQFHDRGDGSVIIWDFLKGKQSFRLDFERLYGCWYSDDGRYLSTACPNRFPNCLQVWDVAAGKELTGFRNPLDYEKGIVALCPQGTRLVTRANGSGLNVWSIPDAELLFSIPNSPDLPLQPPRAAISPDGHLLAYALERQPCVDVWDLHEQRELLSVSIGDKQDMRGVWFSRDSSRLFVSTLNEETDHADSVQTTRGQLDAYIVRTCERDACFDLRSNLIITGDNHRIEMRDAHSMQLVHSLRGPQYFASSHDCPDGSLWRRGGVSLSPRDDLLLCAGELTVSVWSRAMV